MTEITELLATTANPLGVLWGMQPIPLDAESKSLVRRVRTPEGVEKYGQRIGEIIRPDLPNLTPAARKFTPKLTRAKRGFVIRLNGWDGEQKVTTDVARSQVQKAADQLAKMMAVERDEAPPRIHFFTDIDSYIQAYSAARVEKDRQLGRSLGAFGVEANTEMSVPDARALDKDVFISPWVLRDLATLERDDGEDQIAYPEKWRMVAHEIAHTFSNKVDWNAGLQALMEEAGAEVISIDFARRAFGSDLLDTKWTETYTGAGEGKVRGVEALIRNHVYSERVAEVLAQAVRRNGWDREKILADVEQVFRGTDDERMEFFNAGKGQRAIRFRSGGKYEPDDEGWRPLLASAPEDFKRITFQPSDEPDWDRARERAASLLGWLFMPGAAAAPERDENLTPEQDRNLDALRQHPVNRLLGQKFSEAGHPLFLVGGSVRDALAGHPDFADLDYTTDATPERIHEIVDALGPVWGMGEQFGTVGIQIQGLKTEVTTFRTERYDPESRNPVVDFGDNILDDLRRRDLTMNAMALTMASDGTHPVGSLVDPHGGASDLAAGLLRTPDDPAKSMSEDPLRQLRVVRFAAKRNAQPEPELRQAIIDLNDRLSIISVERKTAELRKILEGGPDITVRAMDLAEDLGVADDLFGGLAVNDRARNAIASLPDNTEPVTQLAVLATFTPTNPGRLMTRMRLSNEEIRPAVDAAKVAVRMSEPGDEMEARSLIRTTDEDTFRRARTVRAAVGGTGGLQDEVSRLLDDRDLVAALRGPLPVDGNDLLAAGLRGPEVGRALQRITAAFLANPQLTREEALALIGQTKHLPFSSGDMAGFLSSLSNLTAVETKRPE